MYGRNNIFSSTNNSSNNNNSSYNNNPNYGNYSGNYGNNNNSSYNNNNSYGYNNNNNSNNRIGSYRVNNYKYDDPPSHLTSIIELWRQHQPTAITSREELLHLSPIQTRVQDYFLIRNRQLNASHEQKIREAIRKDCFNQQLIKNNCYNLMSFSRESPFSLDTIRALVRKQNTSSAYGYTSNNGYGNNNSNGSNSYGNNNSSTYNTRSNNNNIFSNNNNSYASNSGNNSTSNNIFTRNSTNNNNSSENNSSSNIFSNTNNNTNNNMNNNTNNNSNNNSNNIFSRNSTNNNNNSYGSNTNNIFSNNNSNNTNNNGGNNAFNNRNNSSGNNNIFSNNNNGGGNNNIFSNNNSNGNSNFNNNNNGGNNNIFNNNNNSNGNRNLFGNNNYNNGNNLFSNNNNNGNIFNNNNGNNLFNNNGNRNGNTFDNSSNYNPHNQLGVDPRIFTQLHSMLKNASQYFRRTNGPLPPTQVPVSTPENNSLFGSYNNNPIDIFEIQTFAKKKRQDQEIIVSVKNVQPSMKNSHISNKASKQEANRSQIMSSSHMGGTTRMNNYMEGTKNQRSMMSNNQSFKESKIISNTESFWRKQPQHQMSRSIMDKSHISKQAHEDIMVRKSRLAVEEYNGECVCQFVLNIIWIDNDPKRCQVLPHQLNATLKLKSLRFKQADQREKIVKLLKEQNQMVRYNAQLEILQCQKVEQQGIQFILRGELYQRLFNLDPYEYQVFYLKIKELYAYKTTIRNKYGDVCWQDPIDISTLDFQDAGEFSIANNEIICEKQQLKSKCVVTFRRLPYKIKGIIEKQGGDTQNARKTLANWVTKISQGKFQLHKMWVHPKTGEDGWSMNVQKFSD